MSNVLFNFGDCQTTFSEGFSDKRFSSNESMSWVSSGGRGSQEDYTKISERSDFSSSTDEKTNYYGLMSSDDLGKIAKWKEQQYGEQILDGEYCYDTPKLVLDLDHCDNTIEQSSDGFLKNMGSSRLPFRFLQTPAEDNNKSMSDISNFRDIAVAADMYTNQLKSAYNWEVAKDYLKDSEEMSVLLVTVDFPWKLRRFLDVKGLFVQDICETHTPGVLAVLFKNHVIAKRAFVRQKEFCVKMVPYCWCKGNWFKNPSPKFHVMFRITRRLTVKSGKSTMQRKVGDLLMSDARSGRGCTIWADQLKGQRLRVVGFTGKFMYPDGSTVERRFPPRAEERRVIGWISTMCHKTMRKLVVRISMTQIADYIYNSEDFALE